MQYEFDFGTIAQTWPVLLRRLGHHRAVGLLLRGSRRGLYSWHSRAAVGAAL